MILTLVIFVLLALLAAAFAARPLLDARPRARLAALALIGFVLLGGGSVYALLGRPDLAARSLHNPSADDMPGLVAALAVKVRERPDDPMGWTLLGRSYLSLNQPVYAAKAFERAIALDDRRGGAPAGLLSAYGETLVLQAGGAVPEQAALAFRRALQADPHDSASRYYLGLAAAARGDAKRAIVFWQGLLADMPANSPLRSGLVDRLAALRAQSGGGAPDISAMVSGLAERLRRAPNDPGGWQRLIRAYAVLGDVSNAKDALASARNALAKNKAALAALAAEAKALRLEK